MKEKRKEIIIKGNFKWDGKGGEEEDRERERGGGGGEGGGGRTLEMKMKGSNIWPEETAARQSVNTSTGGPLLLFLLFLLLLLSFFFFFFSLSLSLSLFPFNSFFLLPLFLPDSVSTKEECWCTCCFAPLAPPPTSPYLSSSPDHRANSQSSVMIGSISRRNAHFAPFVLVAIPISSIESSRPDWTIDWWINCYYI